MYLCVFIIGVIMALLTLFVLGLLNKKVDIASFLIIWAGATTALVLANVILVISTP
jgi:hypothetical protein